MRKNNPRHVYAMLVRAGHSPAKALEIILDARRGVDHAIRWIRTLRNGEGRWKQ